MGAIHEGHLSLIREARQHADHIVVSIFVNPTQFGPGEDFDKYPRTLNSDVDLCRNEGVSLVFAPDINEMYDSGGAGKENCLSFQITKMNEHLCGASRAGHFEGVLQVVNKLFNIVRPDVAVFGQKDIQQWFLIRQLVREGDHPVDMLMGEIVREDDGLAKSSRNSYLSPDERKKAPLLIHTLQQISEEITKTRLASGQEQASRIRSLFASGEKRLYEGGFKLDYLSLVSTPYLQPVSVIEPGQLYVIAVAAWLGNTRLIDNVLLKTGKSKNHDA